jgi:hypothetical protein
VKVLLITSGIAMGMCLAVYISREAWNIEPLDEAVGPGFLEGPNSSANIPGRSAEGVSPSAGRLAEISLERIEAALKSRSSVSVAILLTPTKAHKAGLLSGASRKRSGTTSFTSLCRGQ